MHGSAVGGDDLIVRADATNLAEVDADVAGTGS